MIDAFQPNVFMMASVSALFSSARQHALVCSAGTLGYSAMKEMLQNGVPGRVLLMESGDLRSPPDGPLPWCQVHVLGPGTPANKYNVNIRNSVSHIALYTNSDTLPESVLL